MCIRDRAKSIELDLRDLDAEPVRGASFANYPNAAANARSYDSWKKLFAQFIDVYKRQEGKEDCL